MVVNTPHPARVVLFYNEHAEFLLTDVTWSNYRPATGRVVNGDWPWDAKEPALADFVFWVDVPEDFDGDLAAIFAWAEKQYAESEVA